MDRRSATLLSWLNANAERKPDGVFVHSIAQDRSITHAELLRLCCRIGNLLAERGIEANQRIALLSENSLEHLVAYLGVMAYGATICTIHVESTAANLAELLRAVNPSLTLTAHELEPSRPADIPGEQLSLGAVGDQTRGGFYGEVERQPDDRRHTPVNTPDDVASIFFTSGTEARPKGIVCSFAELIDNTQPTVDAFDIGSSDRVLEWRSFNWVSAQVLSGLGTLCAGATLIMARKFAQSEFFRWIHDHRVTIATGNPTTINMLLNRRVNVRGQDVSHLRFITSSSAPLLIEDWKEFEDVYAIPVAQGYGSSETGWIAGSTDRTRRLGSVGKPFGYQNVAVVGDGGEMLPAGEIGLVELGRGPNAEYRRLSSDGGVEVSAIGRIRTGDMGFLDEDGYLYLTGRTKDLIIRGGVNIAPVEIDSVICELDGVAEAATVGVRDRIWGQEIVAFVIPRRDATVTPDDVLAHCRARLADAKVPRAVILRRSLPKTARGKLDRGALAEEWEARGGGAGADHGSAPPPG